MKPRPLPTPSQLRPLIQIERHPASEIIGIDEVGMGAWAGPVVVGGVVLPKGWDHDLCRDSKEFKKNERKRRRALHVMEKNWLAAVVMGMEAPDVDQLGVEGARALLTQKVGLTLSAAYPNAIIVQDGDVPVPIDGRDNSNMFWMVSADALVPAVSAASILAKVTRDEDMVNYDEVFPGYDFASNKGYHAYAHVRGLASQGPCPIHRFSYKPIALRVVASEPWQSPRRKQGTHVWMSFPAP